MYLDIILLASSLQVQTYNVTSCDMSCDHSHVSLHHQYKIKVKERKKKEGKDKNERILEKY